MFRATVAGSLEAWIEIERLAEVEDRDYEPIRRMARKAEQVVLA